MPQTLCLIKPDAFDRSLVGTIITGLENRPSTIERAYIIDLRKEDIERLYRDHLDKPYFPALEVHMMSGPSMVILLSGPEAVTDVRDYVLYKVRRIYLEPGYIGPCNLAHASDSFVAAKRETEIFFG